MRLEAVLYGDRRRRPVQDRTHCLGIDRGRADRPGGATAKLTLHVEKDLPNHLAGVTADVTSPTLGTVTVDLTFSKWDEPVSITAPPADQIKAPS